MKSLQVQPTGTSSKYLNVLSILYVIKNTCMIQ